VDTYTYDNADRLISQKQTINGQPEETIAANTYDELGQLIGKGVGGRTTRGRLQNVDYGYNIRGWLKTINNPEVIGNDLFTFRLHYNDPANTTPALYNGNISQTYWKTANSDNSLRHYDYRYDALNRLTFATDNQERYSENLNYDKNGNITDLVRKGATNSNATAFGIMDQLTYLYDSGNKLLKVQDAAGQEGFKDGTNTGNDYTYDNNGNMTSDANKGITSIIYNHLNLPVEIISNTGVIHYSYDATGVKQMKIVMGPNMESVHSVTQYAGAYQYELVSGNYTLKFFSQPEGYVAYNNGTFSYIYQYKDHLGNNRLSYSDSNNDGQVTASEIIEEDNYYPFGLKHKGYNWIINGVEHMYKYNGKELQKELGLNMYDYGARNYDPALGRWMNIDPLADERHWLSPYNYVQNNPVSRIDPDGMLDGDYFSSNGQYLGTDNIDDKKIYVVQNSLLSKAGLSPEYGPMNVPEGFYNNNGSVNATVGQKISTNITDLNLGDRTKAAPGILNHYYEKAGYDLSELKAGKITDTPVGLARTRVGGITRDSDELGLGGKAIDVDYSAVGRVIRNSSDIINLFAHERGQHLPDALKFGKGISNIDPEYRAYTNQINHPSWNTVSKEFKAHIKREGATYLYPSQVKKSF
jgi:RHS repeat-associated protein